MSEVWDRLVSHGKPPCEQLRAGWVCPSCKLVRERDYGPDPCMGELPGVDFACCGHGGVPGTTAIGTGYVAFSNGIVLRFSGAGATVERKK